MDGPTTTEPTPIATRAMRVWNALAAQALQRPERVGHDIDQGLIIEQCTAELAALDADRDAERVATAAAHAAALDAAQGELAASNSDRDALRIEAAALRARVEQQQEHLAAKLETITTQLDEIAALESALSEARAKARIRPPAGNWEDWHAYLDRQPPVAVHEINAWRSASIRRLASIGITEEDRRIARLAHMLLKPNQEPPSSNAETT